MDDEKILIERALKAIINWNGSLPFDLQFLEQQDNFNLVIVKQEDVIYFKTKLRKDLEV